jgi:hypothetical protein
MTLCCFLFIIITSRGLNPSCFLKNGVVWRACVALGLGESRAELELAHAATFRIVRITEDRENGVRALGVCAFPGP